MGFYDQSYLQKQESKYCRSSNCSDPPEECDGNMEFIGYDNVGVSSIIYEDTISVNDSLFIEIEGNVIRGDMFDNISLEIERDSSLIIFGLYAKIYKHIGCYPMPPTNLWPRIDTVILPPFNIGYLSIIVNQRGYGNLDTVGVIIVQP